tara:strand:+ start:1110 stop:1712 length:603 start_codon:yes stop_codon:yes gene_type:complete
MTERSGGKLFIYALLFVILFFGFVKIFIDATGRWFFTLEFIGLLFLLLLMVIGFIGYQKSWGERVFLFVFLFYIVNLVLVWLYNESLFLVLLLLALFGFLIAVVGTSEGEREGEEPVYDSSEPHSVVFDPVEEKEEVKVAASRTVKAKHSPGKYVASKSSNVYHEPKCEWAGKIKKPRQVWFAAKEDAWEQGYKAHSCVE